MKKILLVALSVTLLAAGCQKTEIMGSDSNGEPAISFKTGMKKLTKVQDTADADSTGMYNLQAQDFRVWAYGDYEDENTLNTTELDQIYDGMANMNVYYTKVGTTEGDATTDQWAPGKEYYWPGVGKNLRFFAVSGVDLGDDLSATDKVTIEINRTVGTGDAADVVAPTVTVTDFVVNNLSPNADLMVADFVCQNQEKKEVELNFRHALSKVEFLFKTLDGSDRDVFVQSLEVTGVKTKSTLTVNENTDEGTKTTKPMTFTWATATDAQIFTDDYNEEPEDFPENVEYIMVEEDGKQTQKYTEDKQAMKLTSKAEKFATWLVMPQTINGTPAEGETAATSGLQVKVVYVIGERQFESIFSLDTETLTSWNPNQYIKYTVTLAPNLISFVPKVEEWDAANGVNFQN